MIAVWICSIVHLLPDLVLVRDPVTQHKKRTVLTDTKKIEALKWFSKTRDHKYLKAPGRFAEWRTQPSNRWKGVHPKI